MYMVALKNEKLIFRKASNFYFVIYKDVNIAVHIVTYCMLAITYSGLPALFESSLTLNLKILLRFVKNCRRCV